MSKLLKIPLDHIEEGLILIIDEIIPKTLHCIPKEEAFRHNEAEYQLEEGSSYEFEFTNSEYYLEKKFNIVKTRIRKEYMGILAPNIYTGTLTLKIKKSGVEKGEVRFEVRSLKTNYRNDYRTMLEYIAEKTADLLLQANAPTTHSFEVDPNMDSKTLYQRFAFLRSILDSDDFREAVNRIITYPVTRWDFTEEIKDIARIKKFSRKNIRELTRSTNRTLLPESHPLRSMRLNSVPTRISDFRKVDSSDTPENRFVKYALEEFLNFLNQINRIARSVRSGNYNQLATESEQLISEMEMHLSHNLFREVSRPHSLNLNSPALQRKEGYREVLRVWLLFDLAAKLVWEGGDDVYDAGKKDVAVLYEYWLFFKLLELLEDIFEIPSKELNQLIGEDNNSLTLSIKEGKYTALKGEYDAGVRKLNIKFSYNRTFSGWKNYPQGGSWTTSMRPDYTLTIWPKGISEKEAEQQELIVHIHFDAKYKVANLTEIIPDKLSDEEEEKELDSEKAENKKGNYKRADLLKMHAYKDAIRRTGGAYVLYPGTGSEPPKRGFHEIIPGLGAFPVRPDKGSNDGTEALKTFILKVVDNFLNKTSQREKQAFQTYKIHENEPDGDFLRENTPELYGENRDLIPDEIFVNVGYYKSEEYLNWHLKNKLYNMRTGTRRGSINLNDELINARYLLLHGESQMVTGHFYKLIKGGPKIYTKEDLLKKDYPTDNPEGNEVYLGFEISDESPEEEFLGLKIDVRKLEGYKSRRSSALPFTVSLSELLSSSVVKDHENPL